MCIRDRSLACVVIGGVWLGSHVSTTTRPSLGVPTGLLIASGAFFLAGMVMISRVPGFAWSSWVTVGTVSYTHLRAHETVLDLVCRLLLEKKITTRNSASYYMNQVYENKMPYPLFPRARQL